MSKGKPTSRMSLHEVRRELSASGVNVEALLRDKLKDIRVTEGREEPQSPRPAPPPKSPSPNKRNPRKSQPSEVTIEELSENATLSERRRMHLASMITASGSKRGHDAVPSKLYKKPKQYAGNTWAVEKLIDTRTQKEGPLRIREFLVRWEGFDTSHDQWVKEYDLSQEYNRYPLHPTVEAKMKSYMEAH